jgi:hypothetical protein
MPEIDPTFLVHAPEIDLTFLVHVPYNGREYNVWFNKDCTLVRIRTNDKSKQGWNDYVTNQKDYDTIADIGKAMLALGGGVEYKQVRM